MKALAVCVNAVPKSLRSVVMRAQQAAFLICLGIAASGVSKAADDPKAVEVDGIAVEAYVYAYPLVTVELTRRRLTNVVASDGTKAPMGQFARLRKYPDASYRDVTAPNADTLYTYAYLDVSKEPWVVSIPDLKGRFAVFSLFDASQGAQDRPDSDCGLGKRGCRGRRLAIRERLDDDRQDGQLRHGLHPARADRLDRLVRQPRSGLDLPHLPRARRWVGI